MPKFVKLANFDAKKLVPLTRSNLTNLPMVRSAETAKVVGPNFTILTQIPAQAIAPGDTFKAVKVGNTFQLVPLGNVSNKEEERNGLGRLIESSTN